MVSGVGFEVEGYFMGAGVDEWLVGGFIFKFGEVVGLLGCCCPRL
jgi:hypothetical protein